MTTAKTKKKATKAKKPKAKAKKENAVDEPLLNPDESDVAFFRGLIVGRMAAKGLSSEDAEAELVGAIEQALRDCADEKKRKLVTFDASRLPVDWRERRRIDAFCPGVVSAICANP